MVRMKINNLMIFVNLNEHAIYMNCIPKRTVSPKGEHIVYIAIKGSSSLPFPLAVSVSTDRSKLPPIFIFSGKSRYKIYKSLPYVKLEDEIACVLPNAWNYAMLSCYYPVEKLIRH